MRSSSKVRHDHFPPMASDWAGGSEMHIEKAKFAQEINKAIIRRLSFFFFPIETFNISRAPLSTWF